MAEAFSIPAREAHEVQETPFGSVGVLHSGSDLRAWWIWKEGEDVDPEWTALTREDFLYVVRGTLKVELREGDGAVLEAGDAFVIPAGTAFRGYRWPRDFGEPCVFVAVSAADVETVKLSVG